MVRVVWVRSTKPGTRGWTAHPDIGKILDNHYDETREALLALIPDTEDRVVIVLLKDFN